MEDFRKYTTIEKNFSVENTIAENHSVTLKNSILAITGVLIGFYLIGITIYYVTEEHKINQNYKILR
jgi:hypothetical protein